MGSSQQSSLPTMKGVAFLSCVTLANGQAAGTLTKEKHPQIDYHVCGKSGCKKHTTGLVIDSNWRWTHVAGGMDNCYTGNLWDEKLCPDEATCSKNCVIEGTWEEYESTYGVKTKGSELSLQFVTVGPYTTNVGSRLYMMNGEDKYKMFHMKNREFTFTVDDSEVDCGLNGALYFVQMEEDGGVSKYKKYNKNAGAKYGTGYCDAQCPHDMKWIHGRTNFLEKGGLQAVDDAFTNGAVLVMSFWDDHYANMLWLDSQYPLDSDPIADKGSYRGPCSKTSGNAQDLEKNVPNSTVRFSDIRWGPIGSTVARSDDITV